MISLNQAFMESLLIAIINVAVVYVAAFNYKLNWMGVTTVMALAAVFTAYLVHVLSSKGPLRMTFAALSDAVGALGIAGLSSIAVLVILTKRFNFPEALGIALLSGGLSTFFRYVMKEL